MGAGSLVSTPRDLARFLRGLVEGELGQTAKQQLARGRTSWSWNGRTSGFRAFVDYGGESGLTVIFAGNVVTGAVDLLREAVPRLVAGEEARPNSGPRAGVQTWSDDRLRAYEGT